MIEVTASTKTTKTVHSELYRDYLIAVEFVPAQTGDSDPFELNLPARYLPLIDGENIVYAGSVDELGLAIVAAKQCVNRMLLHPYSGKTLTKKEKNMLSAAGPTTIDDLG